MSNFQAISTIHAPATAIVVISINDTNDNAPFFPNNHYTGTVLENSMVGSKVLQVAAVDLDEVFNSVVSTSNNEKLKIHIVNNTATFEFFKFIYIFGILNG